MELIQVLLMILTLFTDIEHSSSHGAVTGVVDGDTVETPDGDIRLIGVDTPEKYGAVNPGEFEGVSNGSCLKRYSYEASEYTESWLAEHQDPVLKGDPFTDDRGSYGRRLRYVEQGGSQLNRELVERGYARVYTDSDFSEKSRFLSLEIEARSADRGLWSCN